MYSPVDGTVVAIRDQVVSGRTVGAEIELRPSSAPSLVVSMQNVSPDPALSVGANVAAGSSKLGTVTNIRRYEHQALAALRSRRREQRRAPGLPVGDARRAASTRTRAASRLSSRTLRILFIADVVGAPGRRALEERLQTMRSELEVDACVVNGENAADGIGITPRLADQLLGMGVDAITLGNHAFRRTEIGPYLDTSDRVVRPANTSRATPGRGVAVVPTANGGRLGVINVLGSLFLHPATSMFEVIDELVEEARRETPVVLVDVHAEATSEKAALARWLDGRVTAVVGTHTHVQTSDATVLPKGTAFITDAGMTGPHDSVIGVEAELAIRRMRTGLPVRFETAQGGVRIEGALVECDSSTGKASSIEAVRVSVS